MPSGLPTGQGIEWKDASIQRWLVVADRHHMAGHEFNPSYQLVKEFAKDVGPWDGIVDLGDTLELDYLASFNAESVRVMNDGSFRLDYDLVQRELDFWQERTDKLIWLQGNHDERVDRFLEKMPMFDRTIDYPTAFHLHARGVEWVPLREQPKKIGKIHFCHGWYATKYHATKHLDEVGGNVVYGHVHKFQNMMRVWGITGEQMGAWSIGCLCGLLPGWRKGAPTGWQNGWAVVEMDEAQFHVYPINVVKGSFIFQGRRWAL